MHALRARAGAIVSSSAAKNAPRCGAFDFAFKRIAANPAPDWGAYDPFRPGRIRSTACFRGNTSRRSGTLGIDLGVVAVGIPLVDDIVDLLDVALGVEGKLAQHRIPLAGLDRAHDLLRVGGAGLLDRLGP